MRIALFGLGRWGTKIYNTLKSMKGVEVVVHDVVTSPDPSLLRRGTNLDGVIVATPGSTHAEVALPFIKAGLPTYIEKPITTSLKDAQRLQKAYELARRSSASGRSAGWVFVGHIHRYNPAYLVAKEHAKKAGKMRYLYFEGTNNGPFRDDMSAMWDWVPHDVYLAIDLIGKLPESIQAWGIETLRPNKRLHDFAVIKMTFPGGLMAISTTSWLLPVKQKKVTIVGAKDTIVFDDAADKKVIVYKGMGPEVVPSPNLGEGRGEVLKKEPELVYPSYDPKLPLQAELEEFIRCIREGKKPLTNIDDGVAVVRVLAAAERSIMLDGRKVYL